MSTELSLVHKVYVLSDSAEPHNYRYVGATKLSLASRFRRHRSSGKNLALRRWIESVTKAGRRVLVTEVQSGLDWRAALELEARLIRTLSRLCSLFNRRMLGSSNIV